VSRCAMSKRPQQLLLAIADKHPVFLNGLADVFAPHPDIKIVVKCTDGSSLLKAVRECTPDIALIDISMPELSGLDVLMAIRAERLATRVIFLTATLSGDQVLDAISAGAKGILFKSSSPNEITRSVRRVAAGKYQFPGDLADALRGRLSKRRRISQMPWRRLTPREKEVTRLLIKGLSNKEIAGQMQLSEGTVKIHLHNIYKKLNISNRTALATMMIGPNKATGKT
jgi:two-component system, NarL family, nitrate/nitrite response regulator NarL